MAKRKEINQTEIQEKRESVYEISDRLKKESEEKEPKPKSILIERLHPYPGHPYKVQDDDSMADLVESIKNRGVMSPLIVRPWDSSNYEYDVISGHRRLHAAKKTGLESVPAFVCDVSRDEASVMVVDSNLHRERILPSEKAFAYKMKMEALSHQGKNLTSGQVVPKSGANRTGNEIGADRGESYKTVQRYIRLTNLLPDLLNLMDEGKMAFTVGVELSYLTPELQYVLLNEIEAGDCTPSYAQANHMHKEFTAGRLTEERITEIMSQEKPNQKEKLIIPMEKLSGFFKSGTTPKDIEEYILKLLEEDRVRRRKARDRDAR
ncbi:MAG: ParB/RepB/Spo0J family partition protein [Clostridia bacterium]|nr:ParB/RepB/Spo0J family partition protein [Clostridia bacterium]